jgi:nucleoside-diphosphate-sugar epimerase
VPRALITGATGLVGSHVAERLVAEGWETRALVRSQSPSADLEASGVEIVEGDVLDASSLTRAAARCDILFHAAAAVSSRGGWEAYRSLNVDGTRNVIEAARSAGARLLHVSSVAVYGSGAHRYRAGVPIDEDVPLAPLAPHSYYARSKRESEALVLDAHSSGRIWGTSIRPDVIYGRRDRLFIPKVARALSLGFAPVPDGGTAVLPIVHAANVAEAAYLAAISADAGGRAFNTANDFDVTLAEFLRLAGVGLDRRVRLLSVPVWLVRLGMRVGLKLRASTRGQGQPVTPNASIDFLTRGNPFTSRRARTELGWNPRVPPEIGIPDAFRWWRENAA